MSGYQLGSGFADMFPAAADATASAAKLGKEAAKTIGGGASGGALANANGAIALAKGVIDTGVAIGSMVGNKKAREQQQKNFDAQMQLARDKFANEKSVYLADALTAQKRRNKDNWKEQISDYKQQRDDAEQRKKMFAFVNAIRGIY